MGDRPNPEARRRAPYPGALPSGAASVGAILLGIGWLALRAPNLLRFPRFWAEESAFVSAAMRLDAFEASTFVYWRAGYFAWPANLGALLGTRLLPLEWAPLATTLLALVLQISPFVAILLLRFDLPLTTGQRVFAAAALLTATSSGQGIAWLNTISSQMHLGILTSVLLVASARQASAVASIALVVVLLLAGLSGAYSIFLWPVFLAVALAERDAWRFRQAAGLAIAFLVQLAVVAYTRFGLEQVNEKRGVAAIGLDGIVKGMRESIAMPMFGQRTVIGEHTFTNVALALAVAVLATAIFVLARSTARSASRAPGAASSWSWIGSLELRCVWAWLVTIGAIAMTAFDGIPIDRYAVVPGALTLMIVMLAAYHARAKPMRWLLASVIATSIATGFWRPRHPDVLVCDGASSGFRDAARTTSGESLARLPICPEGWQLTLYPRAPAASP